MPDSIQPGENSKGGGWDDISRNSDDDLIFLTVNRDDDGQWLNTYYDNPSNQWNQTNGFAFVVSQLFLFLPYFLVREFCFVSCPFQPPSIRPMASIFSDKARYFWLFRDLVSHNIKRNIFMASVFLIAILM